RRGPRPVILGGLGVMAAGSAVLAFLRPGTPYAVVLVAPALIGAGNIAGITPVTEILPSSLPPERAGAAAALPHPALQVRGAPDLGLLRRGPGRLRGASGPHGPELREDPGGDPGLARGRS